MNDLEMCDVWIVNVILILNFRKCLLKFNVVSLGGCSVFCLWGGMCIFWC